MNARAINDLDYRCDILVLGIGNLLWADEGFGIRSLEQLDAEWIFRPGVHLLDGGTQGLYLLPYVEGCRRLLILDAVDYGLQPGTLKVVRDDEVPAFMGVKKMSLHQTGFQEVLCVAKLRGWNPDNVTLIGCQPEILDDYGGSLSDTVKARIPEALNLALETLYGWMAKPERRSAPAENLTLDSLGLDRYEGQRPSAAMACRMGDGRFLGVAG
ncbi:MAG: HyaD/HybD family hydrogenase maturation endopeptidase [Pseudomonadota bacterium]|nr:HyaD/HybD family hydrogenase maturation endopeptidase [Pseudomonadota bacterium]MDP1904707.1 HyaD/HybD family hydrogenase maturation endopeptidase [Pseudomonadota bacterium]MDP2352897.1 HyaD/HybD family hydrogenase maturation endopeptidase [Pseudomonadota bacterium]